MEDTRRGATRRLLTFAALVAATACADIALAPPTDRIAAGPRAALDEGCDQFDDPCDEPPEINWSDTLACFGGWTIAQGRIVCDQ